MFGSLPLPLVKMLMTGFLPFIVPMNGLSPVSSSPSATTGTFERLRNSCAHVAPCASVLVIGQETSFSG